VDHIARAAEVRRAVALLLSVLLPGLAGCDVTRSGERGAARSPAPDSGTAGVEPVRGGTAVIGMYVELRTMNPFGTLPDVNKALERYALYTPLVVFDAQQRPQPWLAQSWDTVRVSPDSLQLTFHLRNDVRWHDGRPVTSADVAFTFRRAKDPRSAYVDMPAFAPYSPDVATPDPYPVVLRLRVHPEFLEPWFLLPPLPRHLLGDVPPEQLAQHSFSTNPVGSGPFRFVRRQPGSDWVFEANPDFPRGLGGPPYLDRLIYRTIPEQTGLLTEVLTGRVDIALSIRPAQVPRLEQSPEVTVIELPSANWVFLGLNTRLPFFDTRAERQAIRYAVDRRAIVDGIMGGYNVLGRTTVTPVHWAFDTTDAALAPVPNPLRPAAARATGWRDRDGDGIRRGLGRPAVPLPADGVAGQRVVPGDGRGDPVAAARRALQWMSVCSSSTPYRQDRRHPPRAGEAAQPVPARACRATPARAISLTPSATGRTTCARTTRSSSTRATRVGLASGAASPHRAPMRCSTAWR
jgi:ABC-type transport system substrate-binding protein